MKFTIRDLFLVTLIVALAVGWWVDRSELATTAKRLQHELQMRYTLVKPTFDLPTSSLLQHPPQSCPRGRQR